MNSSINIIGQAILSTWETFRDYFITIVKIILLIKLPIYVLTEILDYLNFQSTPAYMIKNMLASGLESFFYIATGIVIAFFAYQTRYHRIISLDNIFENCFKNISKHWRALLLGVIIVKTVPLLALIPGIIVEMYYAVTVFTVILQMYFAFTVFTVILHNKSSIAALKYSHRLITSKWPLIFFFTVFLTLCWAPIQFIIWFCQHQCIVAVANLAISHALEIVLKSISWILSLLCDFGIVMLYLFFFLGIEKAQTFE